MYITLFHSLSSVSGIILIGTYSGNKAHIHPEKIANLIFWSDSIFGETW